MTTVGWLCDMGFHTGGAELSQAEFRRAAPKGVEIVDLPHGYAHLARDAAKCDLFAIHNCITYTLDELEGIGATDRPIFRYWNDVGSWYSEEMLFWLRENARPICCSPLQADYMDLPEAHLIPPPVDLERFEHAAVEANGDRRGALSVAVWRAMSKGAHLAAQWGHEHGGLDFYGAGPYAPEGSRQIAYQGMPALLARYRTFVFLPTAIEPFARVVAEAWAAGCQIATNDLVGARYWITEAPEAIRTAGADYWETILR